MNTFPGLSFLNMSDQNCTLDSKYITAVKLLSINCTGRIALLHLPFPQLHHIGILCCKIQYRFSKKHIVQINSTLFYNKIIEFLDKMNAASFIWTKPQALVPHSSLSYESIFQQSGLCLILRWITLDLVLCHFTTFLLHNLQGHPILLALYLDLPFIDVSHNFMSVTQSYFINSLYFLSQSH